MLAKTVPSYREVLQAVYNAMPRVKGSHLVLDDGAQGIRLVSGKHALARAYEFLEDPLRAYQRIRLLPQLIDLERYQESNAKYTYARCEEALVFTSQVLVVAETPERIREQISKQQIVSQSSIAASIIIAAEHKCYLLFLPSGEQKHHRERKTWEQSQRELAEAYGAVFGEKLILANLLDPLCSLPLLTLRRGGLGALEQVSALLISNSVGEE